MPFHFKHSRLTERQRSEQRESHRHDIFTVLCVSLVLSGCSVDFAALARIGGDAVQTNTGSILGYGLAGGGLFVAAGLVSPTLQRFALAIALVAGAFFMGNLSAQVFPWGFANDGPLFLDIPDVLFITLLFVAGLLAVFKNLLTSKNLAGAPDENSVRPWDGSAVARESLFHPVDIVEFSQDALVVFNADGVILELDREAEIMFGWTRAHLVGQPVEVLIPDSALAGRLGQRLPFAHYLATRTTASERLKLRGVRKNGATFAVEISWSPGRSGGAYAVIATICTAAEPVQASAALQRGEFAWDQAAAITEPDQDEQQRDVCYASLERRLTDLIESSAQILKVSRGDHSNATLGAQTSSSFKFPKNRFDRTTSDLADSQWAEHWTCAEQDVRATALSLLRVIDDLHKLPEIDGRRPKRDCSPAATTDRVEDV